MERKVIELAPLQVTPEEAARMLRYSKSTIYRLIKEGRLPKRGRGRLVRIAVSDLQALVEELGEDGGNDGP